MEAVSNLFHLIVGPDGKATELSFLQISVRGLIIFIAALGMVRIGDRRSLAQKTAFDAMFIVLLGSMLSRAINGTAPFLATIAAGVALMIIHRICAFGSYYSHVFGKFVKGKSVIVVQDGRVDWKALGRCLVSKHDFEEDLRLEAQTEDVSKIRVARMERSGDISFIKKE